MDSAQNARGRCKSATVLVHCSQITCGKGCGTYGIGGYQIDGEEAKYMYGLPLNAVLDDAFAEGAVVRVTVELVKKGKLRRNPWLVERTRGKRRGGSNG